MLAAHTWFGDKQYLTDLWTSLLFLRCVKQAINCACCFRKRMSRTIFFQREERLCTAREKTAKTWCFLLRTIRSPKLLFSFQSRISRPPYPHWEAHAVTGAPKFSPVDTGGFSGFSLPNKTSTPQIEIWNTRYQWSFYQSVSVAYAKNFHGVGFGSGSYGGHLYLVCAVCDVTIWRHFHVSKPTFGRSLLT